MWKGGGFGGFLNVVWWEGPRLWGRVRVEADEEKTNLAIWTVRRCVLVFSL